MAMPRALRKSVQTLRRARSISDEGKETIYVEGRISIEESMRIEGK